MLIAGLFVNGTPRWSPGQEPFSTSDPLLYETRQFLPKESSGAGPSSSLVHGHIYIFHSSVVLCFC